MSYEAQGKLEADSDFSWRSRSAALSQADHFSTTGGAEAAFAAGIRRDDIGYQSAMLRLNCAGPGIADKVDQGDGTIDQAAVTDADLLSLTQANWPVAAALYYGADGTPL